MPPMPRPDLRSILALLRRRRFEQGGEGWPEAPRAMTPRPPAPPAPKPPAAMPIRAPGAARAAIEWTPPRDEKPGPNDFVVPEVPMFMGIPSGVAAMIGWPAPSHGFSGNIPVGGLTPEQVKQLNTMGYTYFDPTLGRDTTATAKGGGGAALPAGWDVSPPIKGPGAGLNYSAVMPPEGQRWIYNQETGERRGGGAATGGNQRIELGGGAYQLRTPGGELSEIYRPAQPPMFVGGGAATGGQLYRGSPEYNQAVDAASRGILQSATGRPLVAPAEWGWAPEHLANVGELGIARSMVERTPAAYGLNVAEENRGIGVELPVWRPTLSTAEAPPVPAPPPEALAKKPESAPPSMRQGGRVPRTGVYRLHQGEQVVPATTRSLPAVLRLRGQRPSMGRMG